MVFNFIYRYVSEREIWSQLLSFTCVCMYVCMYCVCVCCMYVCFHVLSFNTYRAMMMKKKKIMWYACLECMYVFKTFNSHHWFDLIHVCMYCVCVCCMYVCFHVLSFNIYRAMMMQKKIMWYACLECMYVFITFNSHHWFDLFHVCTVCVCMYLTHTGYKRQFSRMFVEIFWRW